MYDKEVQHIKVGVFVFIGLVVAMLIIFMIGSNKNVFQSQYKLKCTFNDISGLRMGAPVQLAGVSVGIVDDIRFPKNLLQKDIEITLNISKRYQKRIREDSVATINTQGLLGDKFIFISIGSADKPEIPNGGTIQTKEVVGLFDLAEKGGEILDDISKAAEGASKFFKGFHKGGSDIEASLASVKNILNEVEKGRGFIHALLYDPNGQQIVEDIAGSMASLRILLGQDEDSKDRRKKMGNVIKNVNKVAQNLSEITDKINRGQGTLGGVINDPTIYNDIRSIFGKVNRDNLFKTVIRATLQENDKKVLK